MHPAGVPAFMATSPPTVPGIPAAQATPTRRRPPGRWCAARAALAPALRRARRGAGRQGTRSLEQLQQLFGRVRDVAGPQREDQISLAGFLPQLSCQVRALDEHGVTVATGL